MKAVFRQRTPEGWMKFEVDFSDLEKSRRQRKPNAVARLQELPQELEKLWRVNGWEEFSLEDSETMWQLQFLGEQERYYTEEERAKFDAALAEKYTLEKVVELSCNLDCYRLTTDGAAEQIAEHSFSYRPGGEKPQKGRTGNYALMLRAKSETGECNLYLPQSREKEALLCRMLRVKTLEECEVELLETEPALPKSYLPSQADYAGAEKLAAAMWEMRGLDWQSWKRACAALWTELPENLTEAAEVIGRSRSYELRENGEPGVYRTPTGGLFMGDGRPLHPLPEETVRTYLYGPLHVERIYDWLDDERKILCGRELCEKAEIIREHIRKGQAALVYQDELDWQKEITGGEKGLAAYLPNELLKRKVRRMEVDVEERGGTLWSKTLVESRGALNGAETAALKAYLSRQLQEGWGERMNGLEYQQYKKKLHLEFTGWPGRDGKIYTEEELEDLLRSQEKEQEKEQEKQSGMAMDW